ncbi:MAG: recombinase family protein [Pseudomonadota bacterium]
MKLHEKPDKSEAALIYCRVSSAKQKSDGSGLESQEHRCRQYAAEKGYTVEAVFPDDSSGGGDFMKRPGMVALLAFLDAQQGKPYVVVFDDLKRFARDTEYHIKLRREIANRGARIECLNFNFDETPEGRFIETVISAQGALEREQNRRQVIQKMKARIEKGYHVFYPPVGYRYGKDRMHGKLLMRDEPVASILSEALEGYASGRFASQVEVKRFLESRPEFPKSGASGEVHPSKVKEILQRAVYAGYVEAPDWGVSLRKGHHEPLISFATHQRIQDRLAGNVYAPARKDISADFPLRGFVQCDDCGVAMTSCWSKSRNGQKHPYYLCVQKECASRGKSIRRAVLEADVGAVLRAIQPAKQLQHLAKAIFDDIWAMRFVDAQDAHRALESQISDIERQIEGLMDRIMDASSATVVAAYEARLEKLERQKLELMEKVENTAPEKADRVSAFEPAMEFLVNPWNIYEKGSFALKRVVLKLVFLEGLRYNRKSGVRTAKTTFPFKVLGEIFDHESGVVEGASL